MRIFCHHNKYSRLPLGKSAILGNTAQKLRCLLRDKNFSECPFCGARRKPNTKCLMCRRMAEERLYTTEEAIDILGRSVRDLRLRIKNYGVSQSLVRRGHRLLIPWKILRLLSEPRPLVYLHDDKVKVASPLATDLTDFSRQWFTKLVSRGIVSGFLMSGMQWADLDNLRQYATAKGRWSNTNHSRPWFCHTTNGWMELTYKR